MNALLLLLVLKAPFATDVFESTTAFEELEKSDGLTVSRRAVKGSPYFEYRAKVATTYRVDELCEAVFEWGTKGNDGDGIIVNKVLEDGADQRLVYNQISKPVVAKRDYAMTVARERLPSGVCRIRFRATNDLAPTKPEGFVRMDGLWGEWIFEPRAEGGTMLTYTLFSDPSGSVPPFLVHGSQRSSTKDAALTGIAKTKKMVEGRK